MQSNTKENGAKYAFIAMGLNELFSREEMLKLLWLVQQNQQPILPTFPPPPTPLSPTLPPSLKETLYYFLEKATDPARPQTPPPISLPS